MHFVWWQLILLILACGLVAEGIIGKIKGEGDSDSDD